MTVRVDAQLTESIGIDESKTIRLPRKNSNSKGYGGNCYKINISGKNIATGYLRYPKIAPDTDKFKRNDYTIFCQNYITSPFVVSFY